MDPRTLVKKAIAFDKPSRIPRELWLVPWAQYEYPDELAAIQHDFPNDIVRIPWFYNDAVFTEGNPFEPGRFVDEWGCVYENAQRGVTGEVKTPMVQDWSDLEKVTPPEVMLTQDIARSNEFCRNTDRFCLAGCTPRPFERLQFLRGTENVYMDIIRKSSCGARVTRTGCFSWTTGGHSNRC